MSCASCRSLPCESVQGSEGSEDTKRTRGEAYHGCLQTGTTQDVVFDLELERALWSASVVDAVRSPLPAHLLARAGFCTASVVHAAVRGRRRRRPAAREARRSRQHGGVKPRPVSRDTGRVGLCKPRPSDLVRRKEVGGSGRNARERGLPFSLYSRSLSPRAIRLYLQSMKRPGRRLALSGFISS